MSAFRFYRVNSFFVCHCDQLASADAHYPHGLIQSYDLSLGITVTAETESLAPLIKAQPENFVGLRCN